MFNPTTQTEDLGNGGDGIQIQMTTTCDRGIDQSVWQLSDKAADGSQRLMNIFNILIFDTNDPVIKCMDNKFGNQSVGNPIVLWVCNGGNTQNWDWDGQTFHYHANPNMCVAIDWPTTTLVLGDCDGLGHDKFAVTDYTN